MVMHEDICMAPFVSIIYNIYMNKYNNVAANLLILSTFEMIDIHIVSARLLNNKNICICDPALTSNNTTSNYHYKKIYSTYTNATANNHNGSTIIM